MNSTELKTAIENFGRNNLTGNSVLEVKNGLVEVKNVDHLLVNQISIMDIVWDFSRNFRDSIIASILPELNVMINRSLTGDLLEIYK